MTISNFSLCPSYRSSIALRFASTMPNRAAMIESMCRFAAFSVATMRIALRNAHAKMTAGAKQITRGLKDLDQLSAKISHLERCMSRSQLMIQRSLLLKCKRCMCKGA